jgi:hypothetical protein
MTMPDLSKWHRSNSFDLTSKGKWLIIVNYRVHTNQHNGKREKAFARARITDSKTGLELKTDDHRFMGMMGATGYTGGQTIWLVTIDEAKEIDVEFAAENNQFLLCSDSSGGYNDAYAIKVSNEAFAQNFIAEKQYVGKADRQQDSIKVGNVPLTKTFKDPLLMILNYRIGGSSREGSVNIDLILKGPTNLSHLPMSFVNYDGKKAIMVGRDNNNRFSLIEENKILACEETSHEIRNTLENFEGVGNVEVSCTPGGNMAKTWRITYNSDAGSRDLIQIIGDKIDLSCKYRNDDDCTPHDSWNKDYSKYYPHGVGNTDIVVSSNETQPHNSRTYGLDNLFDEQTNRY